MSAEDSVLEKIIKAIEDNLANENFGVADLADLLSVSKSTLLRTVKKHSSVSVNQFIRDIRLEHAKNKLEESELSISEIAFQTGFSSPSYFIKCYKDKYGSSPGEHRQRGSGNEIQSENQNESESEKENKKDSSQKKTFIKPNYIIALMVIFLLVALSYYFFKPASSEKQEIKSIAVLPFKNESSDSTNLYFVNGMMESILNNLQKISELRVISRTSVEKYRNKDLSLPEIAKELNVKYILEGSGQKMGEEILLTVQLIEAESDNHLWSEQYQRNLANVFDLQTEISKKIAKSIEAIIQPEELDLITKIPTENLEAYDHFLKGMEFIKSESDNGLDSALFYYQKAIALDDEFAEPYAYSAICYYYKDLLKSDKSYLEELNSFSDKAILLDAKSPEALIAKGMYYLQTGKIDNAVEYFEKSLKISPNSAWAHNFLSEIYHRYIPDTDKYLIHALAAMQLDYSKVDSNDASFSHLILANALSQGGMMEKAKEHVKRSLDYNPENVFSIYLDIYIDMAMDENIDLAIERMLAVYQRDTSRLDVVKELAKLNYANKDYKKSYKYYTKLYYLKDLYGVKLFPEEDLTFAFVAKKTGDIEKADSLFESYKAYVDKTSHPYTHFQKALIHMYEGNKKQAIESLREFSKEDNIMYWITLIDDDPMLEPISQDPQFKSIVKQIKTGFEKKKQERIQMLEEMGLW